MGPRTVAPREPRMASGVPSTDSFQSGEFGFRLIRGTVELGSAALSVAVATKVDEVSGAFEDKAAALTAPAPSGFAAGAAKAVLDSRSAIRQ